MEFTPTRPAEFPLSPILRTLLPVELTEKVISFNCRPDSVRQETSKCPEVVIAVSTCVAAPIEFPLSPTRVMLRLDDDTLHTIVRSLREVITTVVATKYPPRMSRTFTSETVEISPA